MFATVNGIQVAYEEMGDGEALVFVHGLGGTLHIWYPVSQQLASDWKTLVYDVRGHGRTDKAPPPYTIDLWVDDLIALLDAARIERATVFGHSSGSLVAQRFAEREPGRANGLVLLGAISRFGDKGRASFEARAQAVESGGIESFVDQFIKGAFHPSTHEEHPEIGALMRDVVLRNDPGSYVAAVNALINAPDINHSAIQCPTLVLVGDHDNATPKAMADELGAAIPGAIVKTVANAGHWCTLERPREIAAMAREFLR